MNAIMSYNADLDSLFGALAQIAYWIILIAVALGIYATTIADKYTTVSGRLIAGIGGASLIVGADSLANAWIPTFVPALHGFHGVTRLSVDSSTILCVAGAILTYLVFGTQFFTTPELQAARKRDAQATEVAVEEEEKFTPRGEVVNVRATIAKGGLFSNTERFTEIETTECVFVVEGEVGSIAKGVPVYENRLGKVRVGGLSSRTFRKRAV